MVSVIIPVYNTNPAFIRRCVQSIQKEKNPACEILLVDDGSSDQKSRDCIQEISQRSPDVRVLTQAHKGVSAARNLGLANARGEYITFVDADDEIINGFLQKALLLACGYRLDIVYGLIDMPKREDKKPKNRRFQIFEQEELIVIKKSLLEMKEARLTSPVLGSPCGRLYRAEILKRIRFDEDVRICEDQLFNLYVLDNCKRAGICQEYWYQYNQNAGSVMNSMKDKKELFPYYIKLNEYAIAEENKELRRRINDKIVGYLSVLSAGISHEKKPAAQKRREIESLSASSLFARAIHELKGESGRLSVTHRLRWRAFYSGRYVLIYLFLRWFR